MKPSSCRAGALLWSRLQASSSIAVSRSLHFRPLVPAASDALARAAGSIVPKRAFSSVVLEESDDEEPERVIPSRHAILKNVVNGTRSYQNGRIQSAAKPILKCTCGYQDQKDVDDDNHDPLPPPLPKPIYSVHKRVLPTNLIALSAPQGRQYLQESMAGQMTESYFALTEQFVNQSDPAFCGVTTLLMVLNALNVDPNSRWKGGWRFYGDEDVLLQRCCLNAERIRRVGITMDQFKTLGTCHGMHITMKRPAVDSAHQSTTQYTLEDFRADVRQTLDSRMNTQNAMLVTSFSRAALGQTGDGHFSPIAAYHEESDQVLVLDVARFKYAPYWVGVEELYHSMEPLDEHTQMPRGWYILRPPTTQQHNSNYHEMTCEDRRPAHLVPESHEQACPVGKIKVQFCPAKNKALTEGGSGPKELQ